MVAGISSDTLLRDSSEASSERVGLLPLAVDFLRLDHPNNNIHNLRLIEALVQCGTMAMGRDGAEGPGCIPALYSLGLVDSLVAVLDYASANQVDSFFESVLGIILCLLSLEQSHVSSEHKQAFLGPVNPAAARRWISFGQIACGQSSAGMAWLSSDSALCVLY